MTLKPSRPGGRTEHRLWRGSKATLWLTVTNLVIGILQVRLLLGLWGAESYAVWMVIAAAISLFGSLDNGLTTYVGHEITRGWSRGQADLRYLVSSGVLACVSLAVGALLLAMGLIFSGHPSVLFGRELTENLSFAASAGLLVYLIYWAGWGSPAGLLGKIYAPAGQFERFQWISIAQRLAGFSALLLAAKCGLGIFGAMASQCGASALIQLWIIRDLKKKFPSLFPLQTKGVLPQAWRDFRSSLQLSLVFFVSQAGFGGFILLATHHLEAALVAAFSVQRTATNLFLQLSAILLHPLSPELVRYHETRARDKLLSALRMACLLVNSSGLLLLLAAIGLAPWIFAVWTGGKVPYLRELFYLLAFATAARLWANPLMIYLQGINALPALLRIEFARSFPGLTLAFFLLPTLGVNSLGWGCALGELTGAMTAWRESETAMRCGTTHLSRKVLSFTTLQVGIFLTFLVLSVILPGMVVGTGILAGCLVFSLTLWVWREFPMDFRTRILAPIQRINP